MAKLAGHVWSFDELFDGVLSSGAVRLIPKWKKTIAPLFRSLGGLMS